MATWTFLDASLQPYTVRRGRMPPGECYISILRLLDELASLERSFLMISLCSSMLENSLSGGAQPRGYRYLSPAATAAFVQYKFGHGESLFAYSSRFHQQHYSISASSLEAGGSVNVTATITATDATPTGRLSNTTRLRSVLLFLKRTNSSPGTLCI